MTRSDRRARRVSSVWCGRIGRPAHLPVVRLSRLMSDRYDDSPLGFVDDHHVVGKSMNGHLACVDLAALTKDGSQGHEVLADPVQRRTYRSNEFITQTGTLRLVPRGAFAQFIRCSLSEAYATHRYRLIRSRARRRTSSTSSNVALPSRTSAMRREISVSQAFSASGSGGPWRLLINSWASSARSGADNDLISSLARSRDVEAMAGDRGISMASDYREFRAVQASNLR